MVASPDGILGGGNAWADKTMTFDAKSPSEDCNLTKLSVGVGKYGSIEFGGITLGITAAKDDNASWNAVAGSNHEQTIALKNGAKVSISSSSEETKITKIVFNFESGKSKGYFTESPTTGGTLDPNPTNAPSYVSTQTWSLDKGAKSVSFTNETDDKAYITSIEITYETGGLDNQTVQAYPYTWNFTDENLWTKSESQFVSEIWKYNTEKGANEWRNTDHEPTAATGYDVDLLRGLRFTGHVCADRKNKCVSLPRTATITIPSLHKGQKVKISYTGVDILPTTNLEVSQERKDNIEIYKVTQDGNAILTIDAPSYNEVWGVWISQISVLDAAPVLTMTTPYNQDKAPLTTRIILSAKDNDGKDTNIRNNVTATLEGKSADGSQKTHNIGTVTGIANGNKLVFTPKEGQQLLPNYTYTLTLTEKAELKDVVGTLDDDTFVFTTAKVIGNAPIVESTSPAAESTIKVEDVQPTTSKQIEIKFNEDIQLLDGALIFCRPMGGSESYQSIEYYSARSDIYNQIHVKGNKLWFEYSGQHLFYGMRYEVTIPTYAIVGKGGQPMEKNIKFYFETPKSGDASDSRAIKDVYTWDFTNISASTFNEIKESVDEDKTYWGFDEKNHAYGSSKAPAPNNRPFAQGQEIKAGASNTFILPELKGLLFNLVKYNSNRFQIVCEKGLETKGNTYLYLNGGTHYVTIQSVPANAMVYIEHNGNEMFNLNTLGVDSIKTIKNSNNYVSVYRLGDTTKDLTFCVQNCKLYRIAIVKDNKTIGSADKDYIKYATYSQSYPVDYSLNERLNGTAVTAYSVSADYRSNATSVNFTALPNNQSASGEGVILKTSGNLGESHPIFTTDVNTTPEKLTSNALVGTGDKATKFDDAKRDGYQNYILTTKYFHLDENENPSGEVIDGNQQCFYKWVKGDAKSNFAYLQLENPSNATGAKTVIYLDWFGDTTGIHGLTAPSQVTSGKTYYTLDGRKVTSPTQKGIYIINGKKIIIK